MATVKTHTSLNRLHTLSKRSMLSPLTALNRTTILYAAGALAVIILAAIFLTRDGADVETLTVHPGTFTQRISSSGKVEPVSRVNLGFSSGGRVSGVYVAVGDRVAAGQVLAEVENGDMRGGLAEAQAKLRSLETGTRPEEVAVARAEVASAESSLTQATQAVIEAVSDAYVTAENAVFQDVDQFVSNARSVSPSLAFSVSSGQIPIDFKNDRVKIGTALASWADLVGGLGAESNTSVAAGAAQSYLSETARFLSLVGSALALASESSSVSRTTLDGYASDVSTARTNIQSAIISLTTAVTSEKSAAAKLDIAKRTLALKEAGTTRADIDAQAARVATARAQLEKTIVRAPFSGVVTAVDAKVGAVSAANEPAVSMLSDGGFKIESYVPEINIASVAVGNPARVTLDAYGEDTPFDATVALVDPAETVRDGVATYRVTLRFNATDERVRAGMTANVIMTTAERANVISVPVGIVSARGGEAFVRVLTDGVPTERRVTTGGTSYLGALEITSGLADGDMVVVDTVAP